MRDIAVHLRACSYGIAWRDILSSEEKLSWFHMGDVFSPSEMKSAEGELAPNRNTAFHLGRQVDVFIWRNFIPPIPMIPLLTVEISASEPARLLI